MNFQNLRNNSTWNKFIFRVAKAKALCTETPSRQREVATTLHVTLPKAENARYIMRLARIDKKIKLPFYAEACNEWRAHLRCSPPGQHSSENTSQQWQAVGDTLPTVRFV